MGAKKERGRDSGGEGEGSRAGGGSSSAFQDPFRRLCSTLSDMLTDRQADARTNLFSIRPMHFKLIVPRSLGIPSLFFGRVSLRHAAGTIVPDGEAEKSAHDSIFFGHLLSDARIGPSAPRV